MRKGIIFPLTIACLMIAVLALLTGTAYLADNASNSVKVAYVSVTTGNDDTGNGSQETPWASITKAVNSVVGTSTNPYEIHVAQGTYNEENIQLDNYESVLGGYSYATWERDIAACPTVIDASGGVAEEYIFRGATNCLNNCLIDGLTLQNAKRGVFCRSSSPTIAHCRVINCEEGISTAQSAVIENNILENNGYGVFGGSTEGSDTIVKNNLIILSSANAGTAAIASVSNNMQCINNTIDSGSKSGIRVLKSSINHLDPIVLIQNNNITNNYSDGIYLSDNGEYAVDLALITIRYNNVWNNNANYDGYASPGVGDISEDPLYIMPLDSSSMVDSDVTGSPKGDNIADSLLAQMDEMERECDLCGSSVINTATRPKSTYLAAAYDYHLLTGSPSINHGLNENAPADDLDGNARPYPTEGTVDIGCYEYYGELPPHRDSDFADPHPNCHSDLSDCYPNHYSNSSDCYSSSSHCHTDSTNFDSDSSNRYAPAGAYRS